MTKSQIIRQLTELRNKTAQQQKIEPFKVLQFKTINEIAATRPSNSKELLAVKGIGDKKLAQFGDKILEIVNSEPEFTVKEVGGQEIASGDDSKETTTGQLEAESQPEPIGQIFTVSKFLDHVNDVLGQKFEDVKVQGEISGLSNHSSGVYFALKDKDDESVLDCYLPQWVYKGLGIELEDGMEVKAGGTPNVYKPKGKFSFVVETLELTGEGSMKKAYELLKKKLQEEGLFDRKRVLPEFVGKIGVITSRTGAVIDDFRNNLAQRGYQIHFHDVRVEGVRAVEDIMKAIKWFNKNKPDLDVLVIMRGGGSLEDLQAFNNELVARAVFASKVPTICGIGHDRDVPITSLVGDTLTSTPTAAAVLINETWQRLEEKLPESEQSLLHNFEKALNNKCVQLSGLMSELNNKFGQIFLKIKNLRQKLCDELGNLRREAGMAREKAIEVAGSLVQRFEQALNRVGKGLVEQEKYLAGVNPERNLKLGYSIVRNKAGQVVRDVEGVKVGEKLVTQVQQGEIESRIEKLNSK
ncbi:MAG: exodeoxyribonuclease VII large subunit [Parcubacteria group bacterium]|nr:exodeoxyribonuclease VII large subunit [Parcubacteria group bacterium]